MACDLFSSRNASELLKHKFIYFFGDSNIRALYKDLLWLLEDGRLIPDMRLKTKNELSHANDTRISNGELHNGCNYEEIREYNREQVLIKFQFITRLYLPEFKTSIENLHRQQPDVVVINSGVWDLTRWGSDGVAQFKKNVFETFRFLKNRLPSTRIIWITTLPPAFNSRGGFLTQDIEFVRNMLPWHILYANKYASDVASILQVDVLDLHYQFRFLMNHHTRDGIHWLPQVVRYGTNMLLTHIALAWRCKLPSEFQLLRGFVERSQKNYEESTTKVKYHNNVWHDGGINIDNANICSQVKVHVKSHRINNNNPFANMPKGNQRRPWKNISNYNHNNYSSVKSNIANKINMFKSVKNPGRVYKPNYKRVEHQLKAQMCNIQKGWCDQLLRYPQMQWF